MRHRMFARRRRRLWPLGLVLVVAALAALVLVARAELAGGGRAVGARPEASLAATPREQTPVNGPPSAGALPERRPLDVRLAGTSDTVHVRFAHPPAAGLLFDLDSGRVLWRRHPLRELPIASLTKMMTALIVVRREPPGARVPVTKEALAYQGSGVGVLPKGKRIRLETMLYGLLLPSGNDAAIALAQRVSGSVPAFVRDMNATARTMGLSCTHYTSSSGLLDRGNHSCTADLAALARAVLDEPRLARIVGSDHAILPFPIKGGRLWLYNNNPLLRTGYRGVTGVKTGYTDAAGSCLVASATRHGQRLGVVLLHSPNTGAQAARLLDAGWHASAP